MTLEGVKTPLSIELSRNDHKISQTFLTDCKYNSSLDPQLFTRAALEQRRGSHQEGLQRFQEHEVKCNSLSITRVEPSAPGYS